jgi:Fe2+ transport system protein FeoA
MTMSAYCWGIREFVLMESRYPKENAAAEGLPRRKRWWFPFPRWNRTGKGGSLTFTKGRGRLQKLMAMGVTPGMSIRIIQRFPLHVFETGRTQIAVDEEIVNEIFVVEHSS